MQKAEKRMLKTMKRTNVFKLYPTKEQEKFLLKICKMSTILWNKLNYIRRQAFFEGRFDWEEGVDELYNEFKSILGSATAQQIIRKNNFAWKSFFKLKWLQRMNKLPKHIKNVSPPRYWKDREAGKRKLMTIIRNDRYRIERNSKGKKYLIFKGMRIRITGKAKWHGKQGQLEILYDDLTKSWYSHQTIEVEKPEAKGYKKAFVDIGAICLITAWIENERQAIAFSGKPLLSDWWYWNKKIAQYQSILKRVNNKHTSKTLRKLYRIRQKRFRHYVNTVVHRFVKLCLKKGVKTIFVGDPKGLRINNNKGKKVNAIIHNFFSYRYIIQRIKITAENFGIKVKPVDEHNTSSRCPWCGSAKFVKKGRLFKCLACGIEAHRDVVGALNIALVSMMPSKPNRRRCRLRGFERGGFNRVLAHPVLLRVSPAEAQTSPQRILAT